MGVNLLRIPVGVHPVIRPVPQDESIELFENEIRMLRERPDPQDIEAYRVVPL